ncbi:MAG: hypothetical protein LBK06_08315 [Planctomycetaceae bacterium]|jgi:hypothetical protein|nr:hypothetical protein [Planctomycetaceae bacterium]
MKRLFLKLTPMIVLVLFVFLCCWRAGLVQAVGQDWSPTVKIDAAQLDVDRDGQRAETEHDDLHDNRNKRWNDSGGSSIEVEVAAVGAS